MGHRCDHFFRRGHLLFGVCVNHGAILRTYIIALPVERGRIMNGKEYLENVAITDDGVIERQTDDFRMAAVAFADLLRGITDIEVIMVDERLSTVSAARNLRESGRNAKDSKDAIDMAAAVGILEFAIDLEKRK